MNRRQTPLPGESYGGCQLFPPDAIQHAVISGLPPSANPAACSGETQQIQSLCKDSTNREKLIAELM